jgi:predicted MFS family arabinose efflux permease
MAAVPALALTGTFPQAASLIVLERAGKAVRKPAGGVLLADAGAATGRGWAFGVNDALDQCGALLGPLCVAAILALGHSYRMAYAWLGLPALIALALVLAARVAFPRAGTAAESAAPAAGGAYPRAFWLYLAAASMVGFGFADFPLIAYHFARSHIVGAALVPVFYALAMAAGGLGSLAFGKLYDRRGLMVLVPLTLAASAFAPLVFFGSFWPALAGALVWGVALGVHESVMSAAVADMAPPQRLGGAYGLFTAVFGCAWFVGSAALGALYDVSVGAAAALSVAAELAAVPLLLLSARAIRGVAG